jgi:hypothetical protein
MSMYRGQVIDRMQDGAIVHETRTHSTWEAAQRAAERAAKRKGLRGDRYGVRVA